MDTVDSVDSVTEEATEDSVTEVMGAMVTDTAIPSAELSRTALRSAMEATVTAKDTVATDTAATGSVATDTTDKKLLEMLSLPELVQRRNAEKSFRSAMRSD